MDKLIKGFAKSSVDPEKVSMSLKGLLIANIGVIMWILNYFNLPLSVEEVTNLIGLVSGLVGAFIMTYGLVRKLAVYIKDKFAQ